MEQRDGSGVMERALNPPPPKFLFHPQLSVNMDEEFIVLLFKFLRAETKLITAFLIRLSGGSNGIKYSFVYSSAHSFIQQLCTVSEVPGTLR